MANPSINISEFTTKCHYPFSEEQKRYIRTLPLDAKRDILEYHLNPERDVPYSSTLPEPYCKYGIGCTNSSCKRDHYYSSICLYEEVYGKCKKRECKYLHKDEKNYDKSYKFATRFCYIKHENDDGYIPLSPKYGSLESYSPIRKKKMYIKKYTPYESSQKEESLKCTSIKNHLEFKCIPENLPEFCKHLSQDDIVLKYFNSLLLVQIKDLSYIDLIASTSEIAELVSITQTSHNDANEHHYDGEKSRFVFDTNNIVELLKNIQPSDNMVTYKSGELVLYFNKLKFVEIIKALKDYGKLKLMID